jgi:hypothetical protein
MLLMCVFFYSMRQRKSSEVTSTGTVTVTVIVTEDSGARILKHLLEAEKSTFRKE